MTTSLTEEACCAHLAQFRPEMWFERAVFLSWYCRTADCAFCYMSLTKDRITEPELARRSWESVLAEAVLCRELGWRIGFLSAGTNAYAVEELAKLAGLLYSLYGRPLCVNAGAFTQEELEQLRPAVDAVCASIETVNWGLRREVCPSKPLEPYLEMLEAARSLGMKRVMTLIIGLGESREDFAELKRFIRKYGIGKLVLYGMVPHEGSRFTEAAEPEEMAWWISRTRSDFPGLEIVAGIWHDRASQLGMLLSAGADAFTKFQAVKYYGSDEALEIVRQAESTGRRLTSVLEGSEGLRKAERALSTLPYGAGIDAEAVRKKIERYLKKMRKGSICN